MALSSTGQTNFIKITHEGKDYIGVTESFFKEITKRDIDRKNCLLKNEILIETNKAYRYIIDNDSMIMEDLKLAIEDSKGAFDSCDVSFKNMQSAYNSEVDKNKKLVKILKWVGGEAVISTIFLIILL